MNNARRKEITKALDLLAKALALAEEVHSLMEPVAGEEREAFDNLSDGLQQSDQGQRTEAAADALDNAVSQIEDTKSGLEDAINSLEEAVS